MHNGGGGRVSGTVSAIINSKPDFSVWVFCMAVGQALLCQRADVEQPEPQLCLGSCQCV